MTDKTLPTPPIPDNDLSDYLVQKRTRLENALEKSEEELGALTGQVESVVARAAAGIQRFKEEFVKLCANKEAALYKQAWTISLKPALTLLPLWVGTKGMFDIHTLALGSIALVPFGVYSMLAPLGSGLVTAVAVLAAAGLVYRYWVGEARALHARRLSRADRDAVARLATYQPVLMQFSPIPSEDPDYRYISTQVVPGKHDAIYSSWNVNQTIYGDVFGASFIGWREDEAQAVSMLLRLQPPEGKQEIFDFKSTEAAKFKPVNAEMLALAHTTGDDLVRAIEPVTTLSEGRRAALKKQQLLKAKLAGLDAQEQAWNNVAVSRQVLDDILMQIELFTDGGPGAPRGMLLFGPPGTGKTSIARNLAASSGCNFMAVSSADLKGQYQGHTGPKVAQVWKAARAKAPCVMFIDECEGVLGSRVDGDSVNFNNELVEAFLAEWDGMNTVAGQVFVVGATNRREGLDAAVVSRFNQLVEIGLPDAGLRARILELELRKCAIEMPVTETMAKETAGMSGRDLQNIVVRFQGAAMGGNLDEATFSRTVRAVRGKSSTLTEDVGWDQIVLPDALKQKLQALGNRIRRAEEYRQRNLPVPRSLLLYGPPGTGKTQIARALASESGIAFQAVTTADIKGRYLGESGARIKTLFEKARSQAPCLLFIDEIDVVTGSRGQADSYTQEIIGQLLQEMDGITSRSQAGQVFILAATNCLDSIDPAILSRFSEKQEIGLPSVDARAAILKVLLAGKPLGFDLEAALGGLAAATEGRSGRDLASLVNNAANRAMERADRAGLDIDAVRIMPDDLLTGVTA